MLRSQPATIAATFLDSATEAPVDPSPDSATVQVLRDDGTELVASTAATNAGTGRFTFQLTAAHTAQLDLLTARWTATVGGASTTVETLVEIVGAFLFTLAEARTLEPLGDTAKYPDADLIAARAIAEDVLEDACNYAFAPRYRRQELDVSTLTGRLRLDRWHVRRIRWIEADGEALTSDQLSALRIYNGRSVDSQSFIFIPRTTIVVGYEHGLKAPPPAAARIAKRLAKRYLVKTPIDERASTMSTEDGTISLVTPGVRGMLFDIPEANAFVQQFGRPDPGWGL
ncbi:MAG: hypothetical protein M3340_02210 [Actinomycetota bacterium]|nr:hypothetical protein [Actinomycetota bacterium]